MLILLIVSISQDHHASKDYYWLRTGFGYVFAEVSQLIVLTPFGNHSFDTLFFIDGSI